MGKLFCLPFASKAAAIMLPAAIMDPVVIISIPVKGSGEGMGELEMMANEKTIRKQDKS